MDENVYLATNGFKVVSRNLNISNERNVEHRSTFVDPKLLLENLDNCVCEQYNNELYALFSDTGHVYIANAFLRTDPADTTISPYREYEWGYLSGVGVYKGQYQRFVNITGVTLNPPDSAGNETGTREGGIGTTEYIGGVFQPASTLKNMGDKELYIGMNGALYRFNFDMVRIGKENELVPAAYSFDGRFMEDYFKFTYTWMGAVNYWKKLRSGRDDLVLTTRTASSVNVTWRTEKKRFADSKVLRIVSSGCSYKYVDYRHRKYYSLPNVDISLRQLRENAFRRLQIQIGSAGVNNCVSFVSLTLEAEILKKNLK
jgi:hypothetical protein